MTVIGSQFANGLSGPASSTDNAIVRWDGTAGDTVQNSNATISDTGFLHVTQTTLGNEVLRLESTATNSDPSERVYQNRVTTTDATPTTIHTFAIPADTVVLIEAISVSRRTGGSFSFGGSFQPSGVGDGGRIQRIVSFSNVSGTVFLIGTPEGSVGADGQHLYNAGVDLTFTISGTDVLCQVTGVANTDMVWHLTARVWQVST